MIDLGRLRTYLMWVCLLVVAGALSIAPTWAKESSRTDSPALWKVQGSKGKVYLFGSIHVLPPQIPWRSAALDHALKEASVVVFETDMTQAQDPQTMQALITKHGLLSQGQTLKAAVPMATYVELERTSAELGVPVESLAGARPWFAAVMLSVQGITRLGFDPNNGVDLQVHRWAKANNKTIGTLETMDTQIRIFADLTRAQENELLLATLRQTRELPSMLNDMLASYRKGDAAALDRLINSSMDEFPVLRKRMLQDRHDQWLPQIEKMLKDGGTHTLVVGIAHLVGRDSVVAMLRAKGFKVEGP